ncbi:MAG TPA: terminase family protein [Gemmatimonadales bacterium]|nr:terminase family protein [Gemmatimonadales bacterium]
MPATELQVRLRPRHAAQAQIVREAKRFNVLQCGRRFGKTTLGVDVVLDVALEGLPVGWFAPTYKLLDEAWRDVQKAAREVIVATDKQQRRLEFVGGGVMEFWSLDNPDPGRGRKYARVVIDEAGIVRDLDVIWTQAIRATLTDLKGDAWFLGTPKGRNYFHTLYLRGQQDDPGWQSWRFATVANPYLDPNEIEAARRELPDLAFRQEYLGEAVEDGSNPFGVAFIRACIVDDLSTAPAAAFGVDLAKSVDHTVTLGLDADKVVCAFDRFQQPWQETFDRVKRNVGMVPALVDSTGVGDPILERLVREGKGAFEGFKFTSTSRQQLLEGLAAAIQKREIRFPDGPIVNELESFGYEYTRTGGVKYLAPDGLHDDCVMALALALKKASRPVPPPPRFGVESRSFVSG